MRARALAGMNDGQSWSLNIDSVAAAAASAASLTVELPRSRLMHLEFNQKLPHRMAC